MKHLKEDKTIKYKLEKQDYLFTCTKCLTLSSRPRVTFSDDGSCNACSNKKRLIDWNDRDKRLRLLCDKFRKHDGSFDVLVPFSGGKDSSMIALKLKNDFDMNPLLVTVKVPLMTELGKKNLDVLVDTGFDHIMITPNPKTYRRFAKWSFINEGRPKMPFEIAISLITMYVAVEIDIPFIMYGEEGEQEYGGTMMQFDSPKITKEYLINCYYNGHDPKEYIDVMGDCGYNWWKLPEDRDLAKLYPTHWSQFKKWNPKANYEYCKANYDFVVNDTPEIGTYINYAQLDDKMQDLHAYMMYVKFGFGRAWSDACIDIRHGNITREEGIGFVKQFDGCFPKKYLDVYLEYFGMDEKEFFKVIDSFRSDDIWSRSSDGVWVNRIHEKEIWNIHKTER